jgi:CDP-2,3-bis-(O-geranylgeranyl)-sn-glycerol synthase
MSPFIQLILETFWVFLPAGVANTVPVLAAKYHIFPSLAKPLHEPLLGKHKTWRGLVLGIIFGSITAIIQYVVYPAFPYPTLRSALLIGGALGLGALLGDAIKSFFKRRRNIAPGKPWPVLDQIDAIIGAIIVALFFFPLTPAHMLTAVILFGILSWCVSAIGVTLKIKSSL